MRLWVMDKRMLVTVVLVYWMFRVVRKRDAAALCRQYMCKLRFKCVFIESCAAHGL